MNVAGILAHCILSINCSDRVAGKGQYADIIYYSTVVYTVLLCRLQNTTVYYYAD